MWVPGENRYEADPGRPSPARRRGSGRGAAAAILLAAAGLGAAPPADARQQPAPPAKPRVKATEIGPNGTTVIEADSFDYDATTLRYDARGRVEVTSPKGFLSADTMLVQMTPQGQTDWARGDGHVFLRQKRDAGVELTGNAEHGEYYEIRQKANLVGNVALRYAAPTLLEPAVLTGARADIDLATQKSVVTRSADSQTRSVVKPKGKPPAGQPAGTPPDPVTLYADKIESDGVANHYVATGDPKMTRGTYTLTAEVIRCTIDPATNDLKEAFAERNVVFDGTMTDGSTVHATGDQGVYNQATTTLTVTGSVKGWHRSVDKKVERQITTTKFHYNTVTKNWTLGEKLP